MPPLPATCDPPPIAARTAALHLKIDRAHAAVLIIADRLHDLRFAVHYERSVARDGLVDRASADQQHLRATLAGAENHILRIASEEDRLVTANVAIAGDHFAGDHVCED